MIRLDKRSLKKNYEKNIKRCVVYKDKKKNEKTGNIFFFKMSYMIPIVKTND